jgi:hypothetical protein
MLNRLSDNKRDIDGYGHRMRNNLGFMARNKEVDKINMSECDVLYNYFNLPLTIEIADFVSVDEALLIKPRKLDGSLPDMDFMRLAKGSDLIDAGDESDFPFLGKKPDLGYLESKPTKK